MDELTKLKNTLRSVAFFALIALLVVVPFQFLSGCNKQMLDLTYKFDRAILYLPNGDVVEGKVQSWTDYEDGDQIQVKIDGKTYLVHSSNIAMIAE